MARIRQGIPDDDNAGPAERAGVRLTGGPPPKKDRPGPAAAARSGGKANTAGGAAGPQRGPKGATRGPGGSTKRAPTKRGPTKQARRVSGGLVALISATVVIVVVGIILAVSLTGGSGGGKGSPAVTAPADVVTDATTVPASVLAKVGLGASQVIGVPAQVKGPHPLLSLNAKPEVLYVGAEYCPFCAAERWSMVVALSRFGTFSGLKTTHSSSTDIYPNTQTFSFYGSTYTSRYLSFVPVETATNQPDATSPTGYAPLQTPTAAESKLVATYDVPPYTGSSSTNTGNPIPFIDLANRYIQSGAEFNPATLGGLSLGTIAGSLAVAASPVAQGIDGGANYLTAAICNLTHDQPAPVCSGPVIAAADKILTKTP